MTQQDSTSVLKFASSRVRLLAVLLFLIGAFVLAQQSDFVARLDPYAVQESVRQWGAFSALAFIVFYTAGLLLYVPGTLFTVAGALLFGKLYGFVVVCIAANVAMNVSFLLVRLIGGSLLDQVEHPLVRRLMSRLEDKPVQTIAVLRTFLFTAPALNTVLAMSRVRHADHLWGTLLGSLLPTAMVVILTESVLSYFYA